MRILDIREFGDLPVEIQAYWKEWYNVKMDRLEKEREKHGAR